MMSLVRTVRAWRLDYLVLFTVCFAALVYIQLSPVMGDPDGFYHAVMAQFLARGVLVKTLPWMQATQLRDAFTDHHFLYHVLLVPFVSFGKPLVGVKLATAFFSAGFFTVLYATLRRLGGASPLFYTAALFFCSGFLFRLSLVKANSVSLIVLCLFLIALFERKYFLLGLISWLYVWLYGGWFVVWVIAVLYVLVSVVYYGILRRSLRFHIFLGSRIRWKRDALLTLSTVFIGTIMGLIVNPYWPQNVAFYWQQIWEIAIVNKGAFVNVGGEWSGFTFREWLTDASYVGILATTALYILIRHVRTISRKTWTVVLLAVLFSLFMAKSRRYIELALPFLTIASSLVWAEVYPLVSKNYGLRPWLLSRKVKRDVAAVLGIVLMLFVFMPRIGLGENIIRVRDEIAAGVPLAKYQAVSQWLATHALPERIVLHSDWDDWPMLLYYNQRNYYLIGLDPTFMYNYDPVLYQDWAALTASGESSDLVDLVVNRLGARYVLVEKDHGALQKTMAANIYFKLVYEDDEAWVYWYIGGD